MKKIEYYNVDGDWINLEFDNPTSLLCNDLNLSSQGESIILKIRGSKDTLIWDGSNNLTIGCLTYSVNKWVVDWYEIAISHGYTEENAIEYKHYIDLVHNFNK